MDTVTLLSKVLLLTFVIFQASAYAEPGVVVLAGGGPEGDIGVKSDWSYALYKKLIDNGDTTGDKKIKVVVLSLDKPDTNFMVDYLKSFGADSSHNLVVGSKREANSPKVVAMMKDADVVFIRGGNQGRAYQIWKGTKVHEQIKALGDRGGAIGGTSSGTMSLSEYSITGGKDFATKDVLIDSHSDLLNDEVSPQTSGIHNDFLNSAPGILVDTHCGERGRVGRLLATMAKAVDDFKDKKMVGVCLEEKTGIAISKGKAQVYGTGLVHFLTETPETKKQRDPGKPLSYTHVRNDALTEGWSYDFKSRSPDLINLPLQTQKLSPNIVCSFIAEGIKIKSRELGRLTFLDPPMSKGLIIAEDAYSDASIITGERKRGVMQTLSFNKLADNPNGSVVFMDATTSLNALSHNNIELRAQDRKGIVVPAMVIDCQFCSHTSQSSFVSTQDQGDKKLFSKALVNMRIHIIGKGDSYNVQTHGARLARDRGASLIKSDCDQRFAAISSEILSLNVDQLKLIQKLNCSK